MRYARTVRSLLVLAGLFAVFAAWGAPSAPEPWDDATARAAWAQAYAQLDSGAVAEFPWETAAPGESCEAALYFSSNDPSAYVSATNLCLSLGGGTRGVQLAYGQRESDGERQRRLYTPEEPDEEGPAPPPFPPQGAGSRNVGWTGFEFYIVDERNPSSTEYRVALASSESEDDIVSDWSRSKCRVFDSLPYASGSYSYSVVARNRDGVESAAADRRAGEGATRPERVTTRTAQTNNDAWVTARVNDLQAIYGLAPAAVTWLNNGVRIERKESSRGGKTYLEPGYAGFAAGAYIGIGHSEPLALMHESMHAFWESWNGFPESCGQMNFYTFKRDQAQFLLNFREYDRSLGTTRNPWNAWRPLYTDAIGWLQSEVREKIGKRELPRDADAWEILANREFYKVGGFYHRYETHYPYMAARSLSLVPPPLQKYLRGFMNAGESRTWADEIDWYLGLPSADRRGAPSDHRLWNMAFVTRDIAGAAPELRVSNSATSIPEPLRTTLRNADRQRLVDWVNTLEKIDWEGSEGYSFNVSAGFWKDYVKNHIYSSQIYLDELSTTTGITLSSANLTAVKGVMKNLESLWCGTRTVAQLRTDVSSATGITATQRTAFGKIVDVYETNTDVGISCLTS